MKKSGSALLVVVIIMAVVFMMAVMMIEATLKSSKDVNNSYIDMQAYYCAESGINDSICYVCDTLNSSKLPVSTTLNENNLFNLNGQAAYSANITIPSPGVVSSEGNGKGKGNGNGNSNGNGTGNGNGNNNNGDGPGNNGKGHAFGHYKKAAGNKNSESLTYNNLQINCTGVYGDKTYVIQETINVTSDSNGCEVDIVGITSNSQ